MIEDPSPGNLHKQGGYRTVSPGGGNQTRRLRRSLFQNLHLVGVVTSPGLHPAEHNARGCSSTNLHIFDTIETRSLSASTWYGCTVVALDLND